VEVETQFHTLTSGLTGKMLSTSRLYLGFKAEQHPQQPELWFRS